MTFPETMYMPRPITAPDRTVCQYRGEVTDAPVAIPAVLPDAEIAALRETVANQRHEIDDQATLLRRTAELCAAHAKWAETYQTERDDLRDDVDQARYERDEARARADELEAEVRELKLSIERREWNAL